MSDIDVRSSFSVADITPIYECSVISRQAVQNEVAHFAGN